MKRNVMLGYIALAMMVLALFVTAVSADGETTGNETTDREVQAFTSPFGAQVRLLMLEKSIARNILWGDEIVAAVKNQNSTADTSGLESIIAELEALNEEISAIVPVAGEESVWQFVDLKQEAINLTNEFRQAARMMLTQANADNLRQGLRKTMHEDIKNLSAQIRQARCEYNANRVEEILSAVNASDTALTNRVRSCEATAGDVNRALRGHLGNMSAKEKKDAFVALKEKSSKKNVFAMAVADKVKYRQFERMQNRTMLRLELAQKMNVSGAAQERLQERIQLIWDKMERIENKSDKWQERIGNKTKNHRGDD